MTRALIIVACLVVILAGIKASASIVLPFLMAVFLSILLAPPFLSLQRRGMPGALAVLVMITALVLIGVASVTILRTSLEGFAADLPSYEASLRKQLHLLSAWLSDKGVESPLRVISEQLNPDFIMTYAGRVARALSGVLGQGLLIFAIVAFILLETSSLRAKLHSLPGASDLHLEALEKSFGDVRRYVSLKSAMSLLTGVLVGLWLWLLGVDHAVFLALLAFFLNYVPAIGSLLAAAPGVLLGFILFGPGTGVVIAIGYLVINVGVSNVLEPRVMGQSLGMSPLVIVLSLVFWAWLLGPIGMLLSVPLTMAVKVGLESGQTTRLVALLLGSHRPD